jgi:DNA-binding NtrC family response regulator
MLMLGLRNKAALVEFALRQGLLGAPGVSPSERNSPPAPSLPAPEIQSGQLSPGISLPAIGARAVATPPGSPAHLVGTSAAMRDLSEHIARFANSDAPVLIAGESGTGKRTVARAIHARSARAAGPFVSVSCAAFGIDPALPGAEPVTAGPRDRRGPIGQAHGGTLFLEEIGDLPRPQQGELLRLLRESESRPANGGVPCGPDVRVITATSLHPRDVLLPGLLRRELYYRLDVLRLDLLALRERLDDLPVVADHVLRQIAAELGRDVRAFAPAALELMQSYSWPGDVRELMTVIRRAVVLSDSPVIQPADLQLQTSQQGALVVADLAAHPMPGSVAERDMLLKVLRESRFNISRTAHALGRSRVTLYRMLARNGLTQHHEFVVRDETKQGH